MTIHDLSSLVVQHATLCRGQKRCLQQCLLNTGKRICFIFYKYTNVYITFSSLRYKQTHTYPSVAQQIFHRIKFFDNIQIKATKILCVLHIVKERVRN